MTHVAPVSSHGDPSSHSSMSRHVLQSSPSCGPIRGEYCDHVTSPPPIPAHLQTLGTGAVRAALGAVAAVRAAARLAHVAQLAAVPVAPQLRARQRVAAAVVRTLDTGNIIRYLLVRRLCIIKRTRSQSTNPQLATMCNGRSHRPEANLRTAVGSVGTVTYCQVTCTCQIWIYRRILPHFDVRTISVA